jgi:uncharacterized protein (TIGR00297 family)
MHRYDLTLLLTHGWASSPGRVAIALAVTASFALLALGMCGVNRSGAIAGGAVCFLLFVSAGPPGFATLVCLFLLTWAATRFGFRHKQELGVSEQREGRNASQVLANLGVAATCSLISAFTGDTRWLVATVGALAEAASDTVASEIGQTSRRTARLITTWKPVPSGTDGGVTWAGTVSGAVAGLMISGTATIAGIIHGQQFWKPALAGAFGMLADSLIGATLQRRRWINNNGVNLVSTLIAAWLAYGISGL